MPVFTDIMILMTIHWTSSQYADVELTQDITFQNLMYTIKFEPSSNVLFPELVPSQTKIIRDEILILDASNSYISNMPLIQQQRSLAFIWECPSILEWYCQSITGDQLAIPFNAVEAANIEFEDPYEFKVTVIWAKPDGEDEKATLSVFITWYDLLMPEFNIWYDEKTTLITSQQNALFYLEPINFANDDIYDYEVVWSIEPELENMANFSILSGGGRVMQIIKGAFSENTSYKVSLSVTHLTLDKLS